MTATNTMTFEEGYTRLQSIASRVTSEDVPVAEMCDLFAEGKGLEKSLTEYLNERKGRIEAIERGEGVQTFNIVAPAPGEAGDGEPELARSEMSDFAPQPGSPRDVKPTTPPDDDIPF